MASQPALRLRGVLGGLLRATARFDRSKLDLITGARCALGVAAVLVVAIATRQPASGALAAAGAWLTAYTFFQPGYRRRPGPLILAGACITGITLIAGFVGSWAWLIVVLTGLMGLGAGLLVALGPNAAMLGTLMTIEFLSISSNPVDARTALAQTALVGAGALVATLVLASPWPRPALLPERRALAAVYGNLAGYAAGIPLDRDTLPDAAPLEELQAVLASAPRHRRWGSGRAIQSLADEATRIRTSLGALSAARHRLLGAGREGPEDGAVTALDAIAGPAALLLESLRSSIRRDRAPEASSAPHEAIHRAELTLRGLLVPATGDRPPTGGTVMVQRGDLDVALALHGQLRAAQRIVAVGIGIPSTGPGGPTPTARLGTATLRRARSDALLLRANITLQSGAFRHALRLAATASAAAVLSRVLPGTHTYWIAVTALLILKPDFGVTVTRGLGRAAGTLAGALIALAIVTELRPDPVVLAILTVATAWAMFTIYQSNYGVYVAGVTSFVVFLAAFAGLPDVIAASSRVLDNLIGIGLAIGIYLAWPTWASTEVPRLLATLLREQTAYGRQALDAYIEPSRPDRRALLEKAAARARLARTNAEAAVERMSGEPRRPGPLTIGEADGIVAGVHRFSLAGVALEAEQGAAGSAPLGELIPLRDGIATKMTRLALALTGKPAPALPDLRRLWESLSGHLPTPGADATPLEGHLSTDGSSFGDEARRENLELVMDQTDVMVDAVDTIAGLVATATAQVAPEEQRPAERRRDVS